LHPIYIVPMLGTHKTSISTPDPWRLESIMTIQQPTQESESTLGQV